VRAVSVLRRARTLSFEIIPQPARGARVGKVAFGRRAALAAFGRGGRFFRRGGRGRLRGALLHIIAFGHHALLAHQITLALESLGNDLRRADEGVAGALEEDHGVTDRAQRLRFAIPSLARFLGLLDLGSGHLRLLAGLLSRQRRSAQSAHGREGECEGFGRFHNKD